MDSEVLKGWGMMKPSVQSGSQLPEGKCGIAWVSFQQNEKGEGSDDHCEE